MRSRIGNYVIKHPGPGRKYDYSQIINGFRVGKTNRQIAEDTGYTTGWIGELRGKYRRGSLKW